MKSKCQQQKENNLQLLIQEISYHKPNNHRLWKDQFINEKIFPFNFQKKKDHSFYDTEKINFFNMKSR